MVAYSFKRYFSPQIATGVKLQTVRADRARHARPGEMIQLYEGMRTRHCLKIRPDVVCASVEPIRIYVDFYNLVIGLGDKWLSEKEIECFARADGFDPEHINRIAIDMDGKTAMKNMHQFWLENHGLGLCRAVLIKWKVA